MINRCVMFGCGRTPLRGFAACEAHTAKLLRDAFGIQPDPMPDPEPERAPSWHDAARAGTLRPSIVGGVPLSVELHAASPRAVARLDTQRGALTPRAAA